jgi:Short-chain dehydrogenases of various substrate specificities
MMTNIATSSNATRRPLKAVVISASSGIGQGCARLLAQHGYTVLAVARDRPAGRGSSILSDLQDQESKRGSTAVPPAAAAAAVPAAAHEFYNVDAFSLKDIDRVTQEISSKHPVIDAVILTQGMATMQGFTPTQEGNDEKMTLHYFSRVAMVLGLLPSLRQSAQQQQQEGNNNQHNSMMQKGPVVMSVLSGGVHSVYKNMHQDFSLEKNYSVKNAADAAGYYNDLGLDVMAMDERNRGINFVHASPGFVNTNWGTEFNPILRGLVRMIQPLGRKPMDCAESLLGPTVFASEKGEDLPKTLSSSSASTPGVIIMGQNGQGKALTVGHTEKAKKFLWEQTMKVLNKAGLAADL